MGVIATKRTVVLATSVLLITGCGDSGGTKAGGASSPVTLRLATPDPPSAPSHSQIEHFAQEVETRSGGRLQIEPVYGAASTELGGGVRPDWDQVTGRRVVSGELEMGLIPARAWDTEGVTSLQALQAPFLIDSDALMTRVVSGATAGDLLSGLDAAGVTGLALFPEGLRHLFFFGDDPSLDDLGGKAVRAPTSAITTALFHALGATTDDYLPNSDPFVNGIADGSIVAADASFSAVGALPRAATVVGNVTLYPKVNSLVINTDAFDELGDDQRQVLREAADATLAWAVESFVSDKAGAAAYCAHAGSVINVPQADIDALVTKADPVYETLTRDPATKRLIEQIQAIKAELPATPALTPCGPQTIQATPATQGSTNAVTKPGGEFPDGTYRAELTQAALSAFDLSLDVVIDHAGVWTLTFDDGTVTINDINAASGVEHTDHGVYCAADGHVGLGLLNFPGIGDDCGGFWAADWTLDGDQLRFTNLVSGTNDIDRRLEAIFASTPFIRVD
jgi:TRAP-type C4-dicarboxylate transport system substrate-binding protein